MQSHNYTILLSLFSLGFFGGFTHCAGMCSPFVLAQISSNLKKISLNNYNIFTRLKGIALLPYHFGRITTYSLIGFFCSFLTSNIKDQQNFNRVSAILLLIAAIFFLQKLFEDRIFSFKINFPKIKIDAYFKAVLANLFKNPQGFNGFLLGIILGFIPCGLLYGAFAIASTITSPAIAAFGMFIFGIATIPSLFLSALGGYLFFKNNNFKIFSKVIISINIITLVIMAINLLFE